VRIKSSNLFVQESTKPLILLASKIVNGDEGSIPFARSSFQVDDAAGAVENRCRDLIHIVVKICPAAIADAPEVQRIQCRVNFHESCAAVGKGVV
jgi:hypothetical protein